MKKHISPKVAALDYKETDLKVYTDKSVYWYDADKSTLIEETKGKQKELGCGKIVLKSSFKKATAKKVAYIEITAELTPDYQKDYELIPYSPNEIENQKLIQAFMAKYATKPFRYLESTVGVTVNFNKIFYRPDLLRETTLILKDLDKLNLELTDLEKRFNHMSYSSYSKYKDCGSEGLGLIPADWSFRRVKDVSAVNEKSLTDKTPPNYTFKYIDIGNVDITGIISEPEVYEFEDAPSRARRLVKKGDVIISTVRTYLKAIAYFKDTPKDIVVSTGFAVLSSNKKVIPSYLSYFVQSETFVGNVIKNSVGVSYPAINSTVLSSLFIAVPPINEQHQISEYLDKKVGAINQKIDALTKKIAKYEELKNAIIQETVLRGLNPNATLKYSGYDWIGQIPINWDVVRLTDYSISNKRTNDNLRENNLLSLSYGNIIRKRY